MNSIDSYKEYYSLRVEKPDDLLDIVPHWKGREPLT